jgi:hypothetical protein
MVIEYALRQHRWRKTDKVGEENRMAAKKAKKKKK